MKCSWHQSVIELTSRRFFIMDATDYWPFARRYSIWNATVTTLQFWDGIYWSVNAHQCHLNGLHSLLLQWVCPASEIHIRRNIIWSLCDHLKWCFWIGTCLRRRIWQWEWKLKYSHSSTPSTMTYHVSTQENLSFGPATPRACPSPQPGTLTNSVLPLNIQRRGILTQP